MKYCLLGHRGRVYPGPELFSRVFKRSVRVLAGSGGSQSARAFKSGEYLRQYRKIKRWPARGKDDELT